MNTARTSPFATARYASRTGNRWMVLLAGDRGSSTTELVVLTPLLILMLLFIVLCGRMTTADQQVTDAAHHAARSASTATSFATARASATTSAQTSLAQAGITCQHLHVTLDSTDLQPGSTVLAHVTCTVGLDELTLLGIPGRTEFSASFSAPVDVYRSNALSIGSSR